MQHRISLLFVSWEKTLSISYKHSGQVGFANVFTLRGRISITGYQFLKKNSMAVVDFGQFYDTYTGVCDTYQPNDIKGSFLSAILTTLTCPYTFRLSPIVYTKVGINGKEANIYDLILHDILQSTFYFFVLIC